MPRITAGQEFASLADFKTHLRNWAVEEGFSPAILDSDAQRVRVGCRAAPDCPFRIRCNFDSAKGKAKVSTIVAKHTCEPLQDAENTSIIRTEVTKLSFLVNAVPQLMMVDQATSTRDIVESVKNRYGQTITMRQAQKVKVALIASATEELGRDLYGRMKQKLGEDATPEEMRRGKRLRLDENLVDPELPVDSELPLDLDNEDHDDDMYDNGDGDDSDDYDQTPQYDEVVDSTSQLEAGVVQKLESMPATSPADLRAQAAVLFQQASKKFQEATRLHAEACGLFARATEVEEQGEKG